MQIEKVSYAGNPERVTEEAYDCVWVRFQERKAPSPLTSQVLQWVDWKLQGQLSRYLLADKSIKSHTTFLPTMHRISTPLVALEPKSTQDWAAFCDNCVGMNIKRVLVLCEDPSELSSVEKELRGQRASGLEKIVLGSDGPVGRG